MFANLKYEVADNINFSVKGLWNERKSKNQAAPLPFGIGPDAGITPVLDGTSISTRPTRSIPLASTWWATIPLRAERRQSGLHPAPLRRRRPAAVLAEGRHGLRRQPRSTAGSAVRSRLVLGRQRRLRPQQGQADDVRQHQLRPFAHGARPACQLQRDPGCVPFNFFGGAGSITPEMIDWVTLRPE